MFIKKPSSRYIASSYHFFISLIVFIIIIAIMFFIWYPGALFQAAGGIEGVKIVAGVDLVLGPLLTLIIYNAAKPIKELIRDISIIAFIQISCLIAGVYIVYQERPALISFVIDTFYVYKHRDLTEFNIDYKRLEQIQSGWPKVAYLDVPNDHVQAINIVNAQNFAGEKPYGMRQELMDPYTGNKKQSKFLAIVKEAACDLPAIIKSIHNQGGICYDAKENRFYGFKKL